MEQNSEVKSFQHLRSDAKLLLTAAIDSVSPHHMIRKVLTFNKNSIRVANKNYEVNKNVYIVGFGKAVIGMCAELQSCLHEHLIKGILSVPDGIQDSLKAAGKLNMLPNVDGRLQIYEGAKNNMPDETSNSAAAAIKELVESLQEGDLLFVLISGGGSSLLPLPKPPVTLADKCAVTKLLTMRGATIHELNTVRKQLSLLKGGGLAKLAYPAKVVSLVLSDVIGSRLDLIASGPTAFDQDCPKDALTILDKYRLTETVPESVLHCLRCGGKHSAVENFKHVQNVVIGNNRNALLAASSQAELLHFIYPPIISDCIEGEASDVGVFFADVAAYVASFIRLHHATKIKDTKMILDMQQFFLESDILGKYRKLLGAEHAEAKCGYMQKIAKWSYEKREPLCLIAGGETTVTLKGDGKGGRCMEMALSCQIKLQEFAAIILSQFNVLFFAAGTDGEDGPTDAAGAMTDCDTSNDLYVKADACTALTNNDSYTYFSSAFNESKLIKTGMTGTNVMDIYCLLIQPKYDTQFQ